MEYQVLSVVIPAHNSEAYIADAIDSVFRQQHGEVEVIVVDDGSTDGTQAALARFGSRIRVLVQENKGPACARNAGIRAAKGSLIGLLDADDLWTDDHVGAMLPYLEEDSHYDLVRGRTRTVQLGDSEAGNNPDEAFQPALVGACLFRASVFETVGLFNERMRQGEDADWNIRFAESACEEKRIDRTVLIYRRHSGSAADSPEAIKRGLMDAIRNKLARAPAVRCTPQ